MQFLRIISASTAAAVVMLLVGCEENNSNVESSPDTGTAFSISPSAFTMTTNTTQIALTVVGGVPPFGWTMSAPSLATLTGTNDASSRIVNYAAVANQTGVNTVAVTDSQGWRASAIIIH
jgi:hypothetical protein